VNLLILDGDSNAGLAVLQSLGRRGHRCCIASSEAGFPARWSRYAAQHAVYPHPRLARRAFEEWILAFQRAHRFELIIPVMEPSLIPLHGMREAPELQGRMALPSARAVDVAFDKEAVRGLAKTLGISTPETLFLERPDPAALDAWLTELPVVVKPVRSEVWKDGVGQHMMAAVARDAVEARRLVDELLPVCPVQVQRYVPGRGLGVEALARDGRLVLTFAHRRLHESLHTVPASTYREAVEAPPALLDAAAKLLQALAWHGVAMVEFRVDEPTGRFWLLEINGRFWGSLPLAIHAGADFPAALVDLLQDGREPAPFRLSGRAYARNVAADLWWMREFRPPLVPTLLEWGRVLTGREAWDGASWRDPLPFLADLFELVRDVLGGRLRRLARG
jgi:predicted ATP-grasp superfamily ATP-dependent carboligase